MDQFVIIRNELLQMFQGLSDEQLNIRTSPDRWSIAQIVHHLYLTERVVVKLIREALNQPDSEVKEKTIQILLDRTVKVEAPRSVEPKDEFLTKLELIDLLNTSRQRLLTAIESITDQTVLNRKAYQHPFLGKMSLAQWIEMIPLHEKRHMEQMKEVLDSF